MASVPLGLIPAFRPLRQAGVMNILFDDSVIEPLIKQKNAASVSNNSLDTRMHIIEPHKQKDLKELIQAKSSETVLPKEVKNTKRFFQENIVLDLTKDTTIPFISLSDWPEVWKTCFSSIPKSPKIIWTYEELGYDLSEKANNSHRDILKNVLLDMNLPKGSHAFWPLQLFPDVIKPEENVKIFLSGLQILNPEWVIFMTGAVPKILGLPELCLLVPEVFCGKYFLLTPHIDDIAQNRDRYSQLIGFLKRCIFS